MSCLDVSTFYTMAVLEIRGTLPQILRELPNRGAGTSFPDINLTGLV